MTFFIVGLGMMGASYAKKLSDKGHDVFGYDRDHYTNQIALENGFIQSYDIEKIKEADMLILCLYPNDNVTFLKKHQSLLSKDTIITDISGVKTQMIQEIKSLTANPYISHHPMAGSEIAGIQGVNPKIFEGANFLIINDNNTQKDIECMLFLKEELEFGKTTITTKEIHDEMISFTSQLPHVLSLALLNSDTYSNTKDFTGDSYRDLTRIGFINEKLWRMLFLENKAYLLKDLKRFEQEFEAFIKAIETSDLDTLTKLMVQAKEKRG